MAQAQGGPQTKAPPVHPRPQPRHPPCCATPVSPAWPPWGHETAGRADCGAGPSESDRSHRFGTQPEHEQGHGVGSPCVPCCPQEPCVCPLRGHRGADRGRVSLCCPQMQEPQHCPELLACRLEWGLCPPFGNHPTSWGCQHHPAWHLSGDSCPPSTAGISVPVIPAALGAADTQLLPPAPSVATVGHTHGRGTPEPLRATRHPEVPRPMNYPITP